MNKILIENSIELLNRFQLQFINIPFGIIATDKNLQIIEYNEKAEKIFGYKKEEILGVNPFEIIFPESKKSFFTEYYKKVRKEEDTLVCTHDNINNKGETIVCEWYDTIFKNEYGCFNGLLSIIIDITEKVNGDEEIKRLSKALETGVQKRTIQLEMANKELESFSYSVSHDLKVPLRAITGFSEILLNKYSSRLDQDGNKLVKEIFDNCQKMDKLINGILSLSKMSRKELDKIRLNLNPIVQTVISDLKNEIFNSEFSDYFTKVNLILHDLPIAKCDPVLIQQVFQNLLSNAIKFSRHKEVPLIEIGFLTKYNAIIYFIKDNGIGFDMKYSNKLFGIFQRLHSSKDYEGNGIGLAIVRNIICKHQGNVWVESSPGKGTTFFFTLP